MRLPDLCGGERALFPADPDLLLLGDRDLELDPVLLLQLLDRALPILDGGGFFAFFSCLISPSSPSSFSSASFVLASPVAEADFFFTTFFLTIFLMIFFFFFFSVPSGVTAAVGPSVPVASVAFALTFFLTTFFLALPSPGTMKAR